MQCSRLALILSLMLPWISAAPAQVLETVVGGAYGETRPATAAALESPRRLALGPDGGIYVADAAAHRVYLVDASAVLHRVAGNGLRTGVIDGPGGDPRDDLGDDGPAAEATFDTVSGLAVDASGRLYISDTFNHRVRRIESDGTITTVAGTGTAGYNGDGIAPASAELSRPRGVYIDAEGRLFIADSANHRIRWVTGDGMIYTFAGNGTPGGNGDLGDARIAQLNLPSDVARNAGLTFIADTGNNRIRAVNAGGQISTFAGGGGSVTSPQPGLLRLVGPTAVDIDPVDGSLYIADTGQHIIRRVSGGIASIVAGQPGVFGYGGDNQPAASAVLNSPQDVLLLSNRSYIVADTLNRRVRYVEPSPFHFVSTLAGEGDEGIGAGDGEPAGDAILRAPAGLAAYVSDTIHDRVRRVQPDGTIVAFAGTGAPGVTGDQGPAVSARLAGPRGLAVDATGRLLIADTLNHRIRIVGPSGQIRTFAGSSRGNSGEGVPPTSAQMIEPSDVAVAPDGAVYITDTGNHKIRVVSPDGATIATFAGTGVAGDAGVGGGRASVQLRSPQGVAVGPDGQVYIADTGNDRVLRIDAAGTVHLAVSAQVGGDYVALLAHPTDVVVDGEGNLYIANRDAYQVLMADRLPFHRAIPLAGSGMPEWNGDGPWQDAADANLAEPAAVALDASGALFIADTGNHRIRRLAIDYPRGDVNGDYVVDYADLFVLSTLLERGTVLSPPFGMLDRANLAPDTTIDDEDVVQFWGAYKARHSGSAP